MFQTLGRFVESFGCESATVCTVENAYNLLLVHLDAEVVANDNDSAS